MTVREWADNYCIRRLMRPDQTREIIDRVAASPICKDMVERWETQVEEYPEFMLGILAQIINKTVLKYIDEKMPKALNRELFT